MLLSNTAVIESTIWHELGHAFFVVFSEYNLKEIEFSERGAIINGESKVTFGGSTDFTFTNKNSELYLIVNRKHFIQRVLNVLSGSIFEALYLKEKPLTLLAKGETNQNSDYYIVNKKIEKFNSENDTDIRKKIYEYYEQLHSVFQNDIELIKNLTELTRFIKEDWKKDAFNRIKITSEKLEVVKNKLKTLVSSNTFMKITEIITDFEMSN